MEEMEKIFNPSIEEIVEVSVDAPCSLKEAKKFLIDGYFSAKLLDITSLEDLKELIYFMFDYLHTKGCK